MSKKVKDTPIRDLVRDFFTILPLPVNYLISILLVTFLFFDLGIPDFFPLLDEILLAYLSYHSISVLTDKRRRKTGDLDLSPMKLKKKKGLRNYEDKIKRMSKLFQEIKKSLLKYSDSSFLQLESERFEGIQPKIENIQIKIQKLDKIILSPEFQADELESEVSKLSRDLANVETENERKELQAAREHAEKCLITVNKLKKDRNILAARLEKFYFQLKETHSKIIALDLSEKQVTEDISHDINDLLGAVNSFDQIMNEIDQEIKSDDKLPDDMALDEDKLPTETEPEI